MDERDPVSWRDLPVSDPFKKHLKSLSLIALHNDNGLDAVEPSANHTAQNINNISENCVRISRNQVVLGAGLARFFPHVYGRKKGEEILIIRLDDYKHEMCKGKKMERKTEYRRKVSLYFINNRTYNRFFFYGYELSVLDINTLGPL